MVVKHNKYAAEVRTPKYRMRVIASKKAYNRKIKHKKSA